MTVTLHYRERSDRKLQCTLLRSDLKLPVNNEAGCGCWALFWRPRPRYRKLGDSFRSLPSQYIEGGEDQAGSYNPRGRKSVVSYRAKTCFLRLKLNSAGTKPLVSKFSHGLDSASVLNQLPLRGAMHQVDGRYRSQF